MSDVPELTDDEATQLRYWHSASPTEDALDRGLLAIMGMSFEPSLTDLGRAALDAYDKRKTAQIRADAIAECVKFVEEDAWILRDGECSVDDAGDTAAWMTLKAKAEAVEELAQLLRNGVKP